MKKQGYEAPPGLIKDHGGDIWWIKWQHRSRKINKSTGTTDQAIAEKIFEEVKCRVIAEEDGNKVDDILGDAPTFKQLIERYRNEVSSLKKHPDGWRANYPLKYFGTRCISTIKLQDIYQYQDWRRSFNCDKKKRPVTGATVNREIALIRHALKKAVRWGMLERNPAQEIEGLPETRRNRYITQKEWDAIKDAARKYPTSLHLVDIMDVLYHTGQRCGKVLTLKWSQIDLTNRLIKFESDTANKRAPEVIWINDPLFSILTRLRAERPLKKVIGAYVFENHNGKPYGCIRRTWRRCCKDANVKGARAHDIRHRSITDMIAAGWGVPQVGRVVGHSNTSTTDRYTHLSVEVTKGPLDSLGKMATKG